MSGVLLEKVVFLPHLKSALSRFFGNGLSFISFLLLTIGFADDVIVVF